MTLLCEKARKKVNVLARLSTSLDSKSKLLLFHSFIMSNFNYCTSIWGFCSQRLLKRIEKLQYRSLQLIYRDFISSYKELRAKGNLELFYTRHLRIMMIQIFKILHKEGPQYLHGMFKEKEVKYLMRSNSILEYSDFQSVKFGKNCFGYQGAKIWNMLPNSIKSCETTREFKNKISEWEGINCMCNGCITCNFNNM